jgi:hypothetical protein
MAALVFGCFAGAALATCGAQVNEWRFWVGMLLIYTGVVVGSFIGG